MSHYLYLVRHGEQLDAEHGLPDGPLSPRGVRQARLIAERLSGIPFTSVQHSPLRRASETAQVIAEVMPALEPEPSALLFDCIPSGPTPDTPKAFDSWFHSVTEEEIDAGRAQMADAVSEYFAPSRGDRHDLLITHNFVIGWFVRHVFDAPEWRWLGLNQANCGLTIIRIRSAKPPVLVAHNDLAHLPVELRTGLPDPQPV
ncbi:histidine phosphatase family protein [Naasia lichenicola]|uniref:Histidine phosphatase family protein n=1 Tax=Naasia lichenicola TaxID=2565933 RepID=A0A4S4FP36_9MICO|nr:histidine phosphatase family protein [Naasia lichenicola]THG32303.1 histidine phosphatase family protein [Naasia lichenicola]